MNTIEKSARGFRSAIQDLLVPELKAIQVELKHHSEQFDRIDKRFEAMDRRFDTLHEEMNHRFEAVDRRFDVLHEEMNHRFEAMDKRIHNIELTLKEILSRLDVKEQVTASLAKASILEKRVDDLWSIISKERPLVK